MINRPHRVIVAIDVGGQDLAELRETIDRILDRIDAEPSVIGAADLVALEMLPLANVLPLRVRIPSCYDPAELHRQRDPHCTCNDCQQHWINQEAEALAQEAIAAALADDAQTDDERERAIAQAEQATEEGQARWSETGSTRKPTR